jgi:hypothetical protein
MVSSASSRRRRKRGRGEGESSREAEFGAHDPPSEAQYTWQPLIEIERESKTSVLVGAQSPFVILSQKYIK